VIKNDNHLVTNIYFFILTIGGNNNISIKTSIMKAKIKKVKIPVGGKDEGIAEMFNQMLGAGSLNMTIAYPKYLKIKHLTGELIKLFTMLKDSPFMVKFTEFAPQKEEIDQFIKESVVVYRDLFRMDFSDYDWNLNLIEDELKKSFSDLYDEVKKSQFIKQFIIMCDRLVPYKHYIEDIKNLNHKFITSMPGVEFIPFPFIPKFNIKYIFTLSGVGPNTITFFMTVLCKAFEFSHDLYKVISSPDVDVDQFTEVIMSNIGEIQKQSELNRCGDAFKKIKESVSMLKDNFGSYYRDFISTKDSTVMMQNFIADVAKKQDANPTVTRQFRVIINYYRKLAQQQIQNPKVKMLFDRVNESFQQLEKGTQNLRTKPEGETPEDNVDDTLDEVPPEEKPDDESPLNIPSTSISISDLQLSCKDEVPPKTEK